MRWPGLVALAACAHTPDLPLRPDPALVGPRGTFTARDGTQLFTRAWIGGTTSPGDDAAQGQPKAVVVIMHGLKDYSARYDAFAKQLTTHGYAVYAFDLRGHGRSAGPRVDPDDWNDYVDDLDRFIADVEKHHPGKPVFLFGHSMGGAIAARTAEIHTPKLAGLIVSGPALAVDAPPLLIAATQVSGFLTPGAAALELPNGDFSSDPANAAVMDKDELIEQGAAPASTAAGLVSGMGDIWEDADALTMPVLAMHGTADRLTAPSGSRALIERIPAEDKTLRIYDGYFHDLVHEPNGKGAKVQDDIIAWIDGHTGGTKPTPPPIYAGHLGGDPRGWSQAIDLEGGAGHVGNINTTGFTGRLAIDMARPRPVGWYGALTAYYTQYDRSLALRPAGVALNLGPTTIGVAGGFAVVRGGKVAYSGGAWLEQDAGPYVHLGAFAELDRTVTYDVDAMNTPHGGEWLRYGLSVRAIGDRDYWPHAHAGAGPLVTAGRDCQRAPDAGSFDCGWFVLAGLQLFGAD